MFCRHVFVNFSGGFRGISRFGGNFAEIPEFRGSATAQNIRSPAFITAVLLHQTDNINHSPYCCNGRAGQSQNKILMKVKHQCAKKVVSDSLGLVDFAIGLVIFVLNLPEGQVLYFGEIQSTEGL